MQPLFIRDSAGAVRAAVFATVLPDGSLGLGWVSGGPSYQISDGSDFPPGVPVQSSAFDYLNQPLKAYGGYTRVGSSGDTIPPQPGNGHVRQFQPAAAMPQGANPVTVLSVDAPKPGDSLTHIKPFQAELDTRFYQITASANLGVPVVVGNVTYQQYRVSLDKPLQASMNPGDLCLLLP